MTPIARTRLYLTCEDRAIGGPCWAVVFRFERKETAVGKRIGLREVVGFHNIWVLCRRGSGGILMGTKNISKASERVR